MKRKYPSYCCQKCGRHIGWLGRFIEFIYCGLIKHECNKKNMINKLTDWLIKRRMNQLHIPVDGNTKRDEFKRVLNTLRENKIMVDTREDGIYIRMAGTESKGECFTSEWTKVKSF